MFSHRGKEWEDRAGLLNLEKGRLEEGTGHFTEVCESLIGGVK